MEKEKQVCDFSVKCGKALDCFETSWYVGCFSILFKVTVSYIKAGTQSPVLFSCA